MNNGIDQGPFTQSEWPGAPKELPQFLLQAERFDRYVTASNSYASLQEMAVVWGDLGRRIAQALEAGK